MSQNPVDALRTHLEEAKNAIKAGEFADLEGSPHDVAGLVDRIQHDVIGATPERIARMADDLRRALEGARQARATLDTETRARLSELLVRTAGQQAGSSPALAAALRRARRDALAALAAPGGTINLNDLQRLRSDLESRSVAASPSRAASPASLPAWIGTVESLLEQIEANRLPCPAAWRESLSAARETGAAAPARAFAEAAETLAATASEIEVALLGHQARLLAAEEELRTQAIELLIEGDVRAGERAVLEGLLGLDAISASGPGSEAATPAEDLLRLRRIREERRESARARLQVALAEAERRGVAPADLAPGAEPGLERLHGAARFLAGAARIEVLAAARDLAPLEARIVAAIAEGWRSWLDLAKGPEKDALLKALVDLKVRLAGEGTPSVTAALDALEALKKQPAARRAEAGAAAIATPSKEELAALEGAHPSGARVSIDLAGRAARAGSDDVVDLLEQAILEARTLGQVRQAVQR